MCIRDRVLARSGRSQAARVAAGRPRLPWFLVGFVLAAATVQALPALAPMAAQLSTTARYGMTLALFGVGLQFVPSRSPERRKFEPAPWFLGLSLWALLAVVSLCYVCFAAR